MKLTIAHSSKTKFSINHINNACPAEDTTDILLRYLSHENDKRYNKTWELEDLMLAIHKHKEVADISR